MDFCSEHAGPVVAARFLAECERVAKLLGNRKEKFRARLTSAPVPPPAPRQSAAPPCRPTDAAGGPACLRGNDKQKPLASKRPGRTRIDGESFPVAARALTHLEDPGQLGSVARYTEAPSHGLRTATPVGSKSATLRVTTDMPCTSAVAAIRASRTGRGSGTCSRALRWATAVSTTRMRPAKAGKTWPFSQARNIAPWDGSRRSASKTPISNSWREITDKYKSPASTLSAQSAT